MKLNLVVIRTKSPELLKCQYELLGLKFDHHQHGEGPLHYASKKDGVVFEIYPLTKSMNKADSSTRLGFEVEALEQVMKQISDSNWQVLSSPGKSEWGLRAVIKDLDGRKVELTEK